MPITHQALKKLRHDRVRTSESRKVKEKLRALIKTTRAKPSKTALTNVFRALDKAAKTRIIHKNTSARLKSRLSKLLKK